MKMRFELLSAYTTVLQTRSFVSDWIQFYYMRWFSIHKGVFFLISIKHFLNANGCRYSRTVMWLLPHRLKNTDMLRFVILVVLDYVSDPKLSNVPCIYGTKMLRDFSKRDKTMGLIIGPPNTNNAIFLSKFWF